MWNIPRIIHAHEMSFVPEKPRVTPGKRNWDGSIYFNIWLSILINVGKKQQNFPQD